MPAHPSHALLSPHCPRGFSPWAQTVHPRPPNQQHLGILGACCRLQRAECTSAIGSSTASRTRARHAHNARARFSCAGPLIYAEAGSSFRVVFRNKLGFAVNFEPQGGAVWTNQGNGSLPAVQPNATVTLIFNVRLRRGQPERGDASI